MTTTLTQEDSVTLIWLGYTKAKPERAKDLKNQGLTHAEIAQALNITIRTVGNYLKKT